MSAEDNAIKALRRLDWLLPYLPADALTNPREARSWLLAAEGIERLKPELREQIGDTLAAIEPWGERADITSQYAALVHDPRIRAAAEATGRSLEWYLDHPTEAQRALIDLPWSEHKDLLPAELRDQALDIANAALAEREAAGIEEHPPADDPLPNSQIAIDHEIDALATKSVQGKLTPAEDRRYEALLAQQIASEQAAETKALADLQAGRQPARNDRGQFSSVDAEIDRLAGLSITGKLTAADDAKYMRLLQQREVAAGNIVPEQPANADNYEIDNDLADADEDLAYSGANG